MLRFKIIQSVKWLLQPLIATFFTKKKRVFWNRAYHNPWPMTQKGPQNFWNLHTPNKKGIPHRHTHVYINLQGESETQMDLFDRINFVISNHVWPFIQGAEQWFMSCADKKYPNLQRCVIYHTHFSHVALLLFYSSLSLYPRCGLLIRLSFLIVFSRLWHAKLTTQIARFMGPTWGPPGTCRLQMGPMLALWTLLLGHGVDGCSPIPRCTE